MFFIFPYIGNVIIPTDEVHHFQRVGLNHQAVVIVHGDLDDMLWEYPWDYHGNGNE